MPERGFLNNSASSLVHSDCTLSPPLSDRPGWPIRFVAFGGIRQSCVWLLATISCRERRPNVGSGFGSVHCCLWLRATVWKVAQATYLKARACTPVLKPLSRSEEPPPKRCATLTAAAVAHTQSPIHLITGPPPTLDPESVWQQRGRRRCAFSVHARVICMFCAHLRPTM